MITLKNFFITFSVFMAIDLIWLGFVAKKMYAKYLGYIMTDQINWIAAFVFYIIYVLGIMFFAMHGSQNWQTVAFKGAIFGFVAYATYDLTNLATLKDWPLAITIIDLVWGTLLTASTAFVSYLIISRL